MATYTGKQSVLDEALGQFKDYGFRLKEPDDHVTLLYFKDKRIAVYNRNQLTIQILRQDCHNYLANINRQRLEEDYQKTYSEELKRNG